MESKSELRKRVEELEKLVEQQKVFIDQLLAEKQFTFKQEGDCPRGGWHDYPTVWHGTIPPFCKKCGQQAPDLGPTWVTSYTFDSTDPQNNVT